MGTGLHVGVIGVGRIGVLHARTLQGLEGVSALTIADADAARALAVAAELGASAVETPAALVGAGVDALLIATATAGHAPLLRIAGAAGLPAFCEKPVALDLEAMDDVMLEVGGAGILVQVGFQRRRGAPPPSGVGYRNFLERFESAYRAELAAFVEVVRDGGPSPCTLEEARAALLVALAADRSRAERRPVSIEEVASAEAVAG